MMPDKKTTHHQTAHYTSFMMPYKKPHITKRHITLHSWCPTKNRTSPNGTLHFVHDALRKTAHHQTAHYTSFM